MNTNLPAVQRTVSDLIAEYEEKDAALAEELATFEAAFRRLEMASSIQGKFASNISRHRPHILVSELKANLLKSGWTSVYDRLQIDRLASARDKKLFERTLESPPPLTFDNAKATFGDYLMRPRFHILRGLAETFVDLDPAYKSHSKVKIGVKGLPKRVIIGGFGSFHGWGREKVRDIVNALAAYRGEDLMTYDESLALDIAHRAGEDAVFDGRAYTRSGRCGNEEVFQTGDRGITVRKFGNGNAHVIFSPAAAIDINRALAEFYGEVLPDVEPDEDVKHRPGTAVSKDLQFYWTPKEVIEKALDIAGIYAPRMYSNSEPPRFKVLEPSCGDGRILDEIRAYGSFGFGIEVDAGRAGAARAKGHSVLHANFLDQPAREDFDKVVMNPPFYGRHYAKHIRHALGFLKPGGVLVSILPATAWYDHKEFDGRWTDLPPGSFAESGTNVPTGILRIEKATR